MVNRSTLEQLEALGFGGDIDALESYIAKAQDAHGAGDSIIDDAMYDKLVVLLKQLKPSSSVLLRNWETADVELDEIDALLEKYGMCSIETKQTFEEAYDFSEVIQALGGSAELIASLKLNGHGIRAVYSYGKLVRGTTRGRYKKGRDITRHVKMLLPNDVEVWNRIPLVEVRGEALVSIETFETYLKGSLKTPLSSVASMIKDSATDSEIKMMDIICYKVLVAEGYEGYDSLKDEFMALQAAGFKIPPVVTITTNTAGCLGAVNAIVEYFEGMMGNGEIMYSCDGIVVSVNDNHKFYELGKKGNAFIGNMALKIGKYWESNVYSAEILDIQFLPGKSYLTPKAIIEPTVTANGATVTNVPLYNVGVMQRCGYTIGKTIYFRFGGEQGVLTCDLYGNSVAEI